MYSVHRDTTFVDHGKLIDDNFFIGRSKKIRVSFYFWKREGQKDKKEEKN